MGLLEEFLLRAEILVAIVALLGAAKSVYNGAIYRRIMRPLSKIEPMYQRVEELEENQQKMGEKQERQIDAIVALGESHQTDDDFDVESAREEFDRDDDAKDFLGDD